MLPVATGTPKAMYHQKLHQMLILVIQTTNQHILCALDAAYGQAEAQPASLAIRYQTPTKAGA